jgi:hypothetical protein
MRLPAMLLVLLAATPVALAQAAVEVTVEPLAGPVPPAAEAVRTNVTVRIACRDLSSDSTLSLSAQHREAWVTTTMEPATTRPDAAACDGEHVLDAALVVRVSPDAPAFEESVVQVIAFLSGTRGIVSGSATTRVVAGFHGEVALSATRTEAGGAAGNIVTFPLVVSNKGNGLVKVGFDVGERTGDVQVPLPPSVVVEPGGEQTVQVQAIVPQARGESGFTLVATPAYAYNASLVGEPASIAFTVRGEASTPTPGIAEVLAVLGALALVHFRRTLR